jgi:hypothetical protein
LVSPLRKTGTTTTITLRDIDLKSIAPLIPLLLKRKRRKGNYSFQYAEVNREGEQTASRDPPFL